MDFTYSHAAHINELNGEIQSVQEHCRHVAELCAEMAIPPLKEFSQATGLAHDIGKYQPGFERRLAGENVRVEHSTCGALAVMEIYGKAQPASWMMAYCIAGHHTGLPDGGFANDTPDQTTLQGRMKRRFEDYSAYKQELVFPDIHVQSWMQFLAGDCGRDRERLVDKFAFLTRYVFSCLVDADSRDTSDFCSGGQKPEKLKGDFGACLKRVNARLESFHCHTGLQKARAQLQNQAFTNASKEAEIYLMNMPTGSGKTLASVKIALDLAIREHRKRIIYVIPYNSIIDQTAMVLEGLFQDDMEILRHQSTYSYEERDDAGEDYRSAAKNAAEDYDAPFILTTAVQFFESLYSNKRGKLRKLHNLAESVLVFDEAHLMPVPFLQPCLQGIAYITRYLNSRAVFLTATMPDFPELLKEYALPDSKVTNLITDTSLFSRFQKCRYQYLGVKAGSSIIEQSRQYPSALIIVNTKKAAAELFENCGGEKYHLSTYMTPYDRKRVLNKIRERLIQLREDYPDAKNVPEERRITVISTSLIEAGVDLDMDTVFREIAGLDSILQAGGRCNREGLRPVGDVWIFELERESGKRRAIDEKMSLSQGLLQKYPDISESACIAEFYNCLYFLKKEELQEHTMHRYCSDVRSIPFDTYARGFQLISQKTVSLAVPRDENSRDMIEELRILGKTNVRKLQNYVCSLYQTELDDLLRQHAAGDFGTGVYCLLNEDYYDEELGIRFQGRDYFI